MIIDDAGIFKVQRQPAPSLRGARSANSSSARGGWANAGFRGGSAASARGGVQRAASAQPPSELADAPALDEELGWPAERARAIRTQARGGVRPVGSAARRVIRSAAHEEGESGVGAWLQALDAEPSTREVEVEVEAEAEAEGPEGSDARAVQGWLAANRPLLAGPEGSRAAVVASRFAERHAALAANGRSSLEALRRSPPSEPRRRRFEEALRELQAHRVNLPPEGGVGSAGGVAPAGVDADGAPTGGGHGRGAAPAAEEGSWDGLWDELVARLEASLQREQAAARARRRPRLAAPALAPAPALEPAAGPAADAPAAPDAAPGVQPPAPVPLLSAHERASLAGRLRRHCKLLWRFFFYYRAMPGLAAELPAGGRLPHEAGGPSAAELQGMPPPLPAAPPAAGSAGAPRISLAQVWRLAREVRAVGSAGGCSCAQLDAVWAAAGIFEAPEPRPDEAAGAPGAPAGSAGGGAGAAALPSAHEPLGSAPFGGFCEALLLLARAVHGQSARWPSAAFERLCADGLEERGCQGDGYCDWLRAALRLPLVAALLRSRAPELRWLYTRWAVVSVPSGDRPGAPARQPVGSGSGGGSGCLSCNHVLLLLAESGLLAARPAADDARLVSAAEAVALVELATDTRGAQPALCEANGALQLTPSEWVELVARLGAHLSRRPPEQLLAAGADADGGGADGGGGEGGPGGEAGALLAQAVEKLLDDALLPKARRRFEAAKG